MNWSKSKSIMLSRICTVACALALAVLCVLELRLAVLEARSGSGSYELWLTVTLFAFAVPAYTALWQLYTLLRNIGRGSVFVAGNVRCLRIISWCCFAACVIFAVSGYRISWFLLLGSACAAFAGLIMRVVKNVFAAAVELQDDQDLTI